MDQEVLGRGEDLYVHAEFNNGDITEGLVRIKNFFGAGGGGAVLIVSDRHNMTPREARAARICSLADFVRISAFCEIEISHDESETRAEIHRRH